MKVADILLWWLAMYTSVAFLWAGSTALWVRSAVQNLGGTPPCIIRESLLLNEKSKCVLRLIVGLYACAPVGT